MLSATNFWMCFAGLICLIAGVFVLRTEISSARGWDKFITLAPVFVAVPLAAFAPEHFRGPDYVRNMVPSWMPLPWFWTYFVGCSLFAAATSLTLGKFTRLSATMLAVMFSLFVCLIYLPSVLAHPRDRFAWIFLFRDLSFAAGAWALAGRYSRDTSARESEWMIFFSRAVIATAAILFAAQHFLHPGFALGVPLETKMPAWVPVPTVWASLAGGILLVAGIGLALNQHARIAAASIGALMTFLTALPYLVVVILAHAAPATEMNDAINDVADVWLYAGSALALASALPVRV